MSVVAKYQFKEKAQKLLTLAGIKIDGRHPWDIKVHNPDFYQRVIAGGSLALGESYMDGWWDCRRLDEFFDRIVSARLDEKVKPLSLVLDFLKASLINRQRKSRAFVPGKHYDIGNDLYKAMLDKRMTYTCAYWKDASTLDKAQEAKLDLVCRKLNLKPGQKILDIGCGWGSFMKFAAEKYKVKAVGITVSKEQVELGREICKGLPIEFRLQDYRDVDGRFDHIVSLGMIEHVGHKNYRKYMEIAHRCLKDDGLFLLHTIGGNKSATSIDPWIDKHIFHDAVLPSIRQIGTAIEGLFVMEDWHNFGQDYDKTLMAWFRNFDNAWSRLKSQYDERFYRMWKYYLLACAGTFRARKNQLWQIVLSKKGVIGGHSPIR